MQKRIALVCMLFLLIGCKKVEDNDHYIELVNNCLNDKHMTNNVARGYQYYVPRGVKKIHDYDYNQTFLIDDCTVYLYVDIISYYYKKELQAQQNSEDNYYQFIQNGDKNGYIKIRKDGEQYFLSIVYHYSKIETYTTKKNLSKIITLSSIILNSIDYNDVVIEKVLSRDLGQFSEFTYEIDKPDGASSNFSQFLEEYVQKEEDTEQLPDK